MKGRIQDIELLRAVAVLSVVLHHAHGNLFTWPTPWLDTFFQHFDLWWGVDLFFAISGYVIARELLPKLQSGTSMAGYWRITLAFWTRRAFRLLPSAWLWLILILLACRFLNTSGAFGTLQANLAATLAGALQFANFRFADSFMRYEYGTSFVYWSLSLEEQFYLLLPVLVLLSRRFLPWLLLLLVAVQFFTWRTPLLMSVRTDAIALGVLLAFWNQSRTCGALKLRFLHRRLPALGIAALLVLVMMEASTQKYVWSTYRIGVIALCSTGLVWLASLDRNYFALPAQLQRAMLWIGSRSYAIYLVHIPAFSLTQEIWYRLRGTKEFDASYTWAFTITVSLLVLVASELNYRWVEAPLRRQGAQLAKRISLPAPATTPSQRTNNETA